MWHASAGPSLAFSATCHKSWSTLSLSNCKAMGWNFFGESVTFPLSGTCYHMPGSPMMLLECLKVP